MCQFKEKKNNTLIISDNVQLNPDYDQVSNASK